MVRHIATSQNPKSNAVGVDQFTNGTWISEASRKGSYLNALAQQLGYVLPNGTVKSEFKADFLSLRENPETSILEGADYDRYVYNTLAAKGLIPQNVSSNDLAKIMYIGHHEGPGGAEAILTGNLSDTRARYLISINVPISQQATVLSEYGSPARGYIGWIWNLVNSKIAQTSQ